MRAGDLMTKNPATCFTDDTVRRAAELMGDFDCGAIPVVDRAEGNRVMGIVTDRDIAVRVVAKGQTLETPVSQIMSGPPVSVWEEADVLEVERLMKERQLRRIVVTDQAQRCLGIIAQADLARAVKREEGIREQEVAAVIERVSEPTVASNRDLSRTASPRTPPPS